MSQLESIFIDRFIKDKNNLQIYNLQGEYDYFKIEGESLDFKIFLVLEKES